MRQHRLSSVGFNVDNIEFGNLPIVDLVDTKACPICGTSDALGWLNTTRAKTPTGEWFIMGFSCGRCAEDYVVRIKIDWDDGEHVRTAKLCEVLEGFQQMDRTEFDDLPILQSPDDLPACPECGVQMEIVGQEDQDERWLILLAACGNCGTELIFRGEK